MKLKNQAKASKQGDFTNNFNIFIVNIWWCICTQHHHNLMYLKIDSNKVWFNEKYEQ
jgi:hypothetical protein